MILKVKTLADVPSSEITPEHVCASAAIPLVFPPVRIPSLGGNLWFGDGALRLVTPLSPAIRLGASRLLAIGVRSNQAADALSRAEIGGAIACPPLAQVCGVFLNAIFLDHLDADLDHLHRMNELIRAYDMSLKDGKQPSAARWRVGTSERSIGVNAAVIQWQNASFPSWTSPVRIRSAAPTSRGLRGDP